jgi:hypothetical protein
VQLEPEVLAVLYIEIALAQYSYGHIDPGRQYLQEASLILGLDMHVTGGAGAC